ncbi:60S ribosomal protein L39-3 [Nymphaea thermarum]|nr:60S ribosomal protein L39-3 [Nymphaea thermarum]
MTSRSHYIKPTHKTFKIKKKLAKKMRQNRPIPHWIRMRTDNTIRYNAKRRHWRRTKYSSSLKNEEAWAKLWHYMLSGIVGSWNDSLKKCKSYRYTEGVGIFLGPDYLLKELLFSLRYNIVCLLRSRKSRRGFLWFLFEGGLGVRAFYYRKLNALTNNLLVSSSLELRKSNFQVANKDITVFNCERKMRKTNSWDVILEL